jgi:regulator of protease activity HflC (stomatin/prohibitin superfamily)
MISNTYVIVLIAVAFVGFLSSAIRILREYERGTIFTLGRFSGVKGPGLIILIPIVQKMVKVDLRIYVQDVPSQDVISRDNVSVKVNAVLYYRVVDAEKVVIQVSDYRMATSQLAQTTLRSVLGKHDLDEMLAERDKLNDDIQEILDVHTDAWGIKVNNVEIKHVDIDDSMVRAIARQAEAERNRRAKIINAEGEEQAAEKLVTAARKMVSQRESLQLRYLGTLAEISNDRVSTVVFPFPVEMMHSMFSQDALQAGKQRALSETTHESGE